MPVIVPASPVIAANTSLFQVPSRARWAISRAVRLNVRAILNFTPRTRRSLGGTSICLTVLSVVLRVRARFIQSVNGFSSSVGVGNALNLACPRSFSRLQGSCSLGVLLLPR